MIITNMKGLCEECLASNIEVKFIKGKTICAKCANKDSNK
jgi:hypothetical protein